MAAIDNTLRIPTTLTSPAAARIRCPVRHSSVVRIAVFSDRFVVLALTPVAAHGSIGAPQLEPHTPDEPSEDTMRNAALVMAVAGTIIGAGTSTADAQGGPGQWYVVLNSCLTQGGGCASWANTDDHIAVYVTGINDPPGYFRMVQTIDMDGAYEKVFAPQPGTEAIQLSFSQIRSVTIRMYGSDMYWLDFIRMTYLNGTYWSAGVDNTQGWCMSQDPLDYQGQEAWCSPDESVEWKTFTVH